LSVKVLRAYYQASPPVPLCSEQELPKLLLVIVEPLMFTVDDPHLVKLGVPLLPLAR